MNTNLPTPVRAFVPLIAILCGAFLFDLLFHGMALGVNLLLFAVFISAMLVVRVGRTALSIPAWGALLGALVAAAMVSVHNSALAVFMAVASLGAGSAFAHEPKLRSLLYSIPQLASNFLMLPVVAWEGTGELMQRRSGARAGWRWGRIALLPLLVGIVFFSLYRAGNPRFDQLTAGFLDGLWEIFGDLLEALFTERFFFFLFGMAVCAALLFRYAPKLVLQLEQQYADGLERVRRKRPHWLAPRSLNPLERERRMGLVLLVLVNALLLVVNIIDIDWVWFGFEVPEGFSLKQFVHEGTWILIISILLSMLLLLHLFRRNLNFYWRSGSLRIMAYVWIAQNLVLGISVFMRNYHYIDFHGLAYLRIGVIAFLLLVLVGLVTLWMKIRNRRSFYWLIRVNAWAAFVLLIGMTTVDWDRAIVRFNLHHDNPGEIDIDNYLAMSDRVLPLLYANLDLVEAQMARHSTNRVRWVRNLEPGDFRHTLDSKRDRFLARYRDQHWQERNLADDRTAKALLQAMHAR